MPFCDLHVHSIRSACGFHTFLEIVAIMRAKGQEAFALTDHGPALGTPRSHFSVLLRRMPRVVEGVRVFKGIEASIMDTAGTVDLPLFAGVSYEIVLAGLHQHHAFLTSQGITHNTRAITNALRACPAIKVLTHPYFESLPVDLDAITDIATETGVALEVNNSHLLTRKANTDRLDRMLELAREKGSLIAVNSDGHVFSEMGDLTLALERLAPHDIDPANIVNRSLESTLAFLGLEE